MQDFNDYPNMSGSYRKTLMGGGGDSYAAQEVEILGNLLPALFGDP